MNCLDILAENMARANLDIAISLLQEGLSENVVSRERESKLNELTIYVSNAIWGNRASIAQIKKEIIPLFKQVYEQLKDQHYQENIKLRLMNIRRYARGLSPILPQKYIPEEIKNRLSPEMIEQLSS